MESRKRMVRELKFLGEQGIYEVEPTIRFLKYRTLIVGFTIRNTHSKFKNSARS